MYAFLLISKFCKLCYKVLSFVLLLCCINKLLRYLGTGAGSGAGIGVGERAGAGEGAGEGAGARAAAGADKNLQVG